MTTASTPREPWDDDRLDAAFAARAARTSTPVDLAGATGAVLRRRAVTVPLLRRILAPAAVVVLAVGLVGAGVVLREGDRSATTPEPSDRSPRPSPSSTLDGGPTVFGLPVMTVSDAIDVRDSGDDAQEIVVRGWYAAHAPERACGLPKLPKPIAALQVRCPDQLLWLTQDREQLTTMTATSTSWHGPTGLAINPHFDDVDMAWSAPAGDSYRPAELVVIGHFDDAGTGRCPASEQSACRDRFVVDRIHSVDGVEQPLSVVDRVDGAELSTQDDIRATVEREASQRPILSMVIVDRRVEGLSDGPSSTVWVARVLGLRFLEHHVVFDSTDEVAMVRTSGPPKFAVPPPGEPVDESLGLPVITVQELIARQAAGPWPEEVAVRGWALRSSVVYDCAIHMDPHHPLVPFCQSPVFLMEVPEPMAGDSTAGPSMRMLLGPDAYVDVEIPYIDPVDVIAVGHFLDHRWPTCPVLDQAACQRQFVVDRLVRADVPVDDPYGPWTIGDAPPGPDLVTTVGRLEVRVGEVTVLSAGSLRASDLASIEPQASEIGRTLGDAPVRLLRVLVAPDPAMPRTFLVWEPAGERETIWELTEDGPEELPPAEPGEATPPPVAPSTPSPDGRIRVELWAASTPDGEPVRVTIVDRSGRVTSAREARPDDPAWSAVLTGDAGVMVDEARRVRLLWTGSVCDGAAVVTIGPDFETIHIDGGARLACDAMAIGRELVLETSATIDSAAVRVSYDVTVVRGD